MQNDCCGLIKRCSASIRLQQILAKWYICNKTHFCSVTCVSVQEERLQLAIYVGNADGPGEVPILALHQRRYSED